MFALLRATSRRDMVAAVQHTTELPAMIKAVVAGGLAAMKDETFNEYRGLIAETIAALNETERGRSVLARIGVEVEAADGVSG